MSENDEPRAKRPAAFWLTLSCLIPILYVASVGPVCWCCHRWCLYRAGYDELLNAVLVVFYQPLIWFGGRAHWFGDFLDWYADLF